jgi:hypothetical protein
LRRRCLANVGARDWKRIGLEAELLQEVSDLRRLTQELRKLRKLIAEDHVS